MRQVAIVCAPASLTASVNFGGSLLSDSAQVLKVFRHMDFPTYSLLFSSMDSRWHGPLFDLASEAMLCWHLFSFENGGFGTFCMFCVVSECVTGCHWLLGSMDHHGSPWITMDCRNQLLRRNSELTNSESQHYCLVLC